jgi:L-ascorbate metabolism protein UlaG (beta-lactamase superfamily)
VPDLSLCEAPLGGTLAAALERPAPGDGAVHAYWLGQAGFVLDHASARVVIDPYLSDSLARKYAGREWSHQRMMPAPIAPGQLTGATLILCTHRHSDHMDPETLPALAGANPGARVVVPAAERDRALELGVPEGRLTALDAGERCQLGGVAIEAVAAAHEALTYDAQGRCVFLGYLLRLGGLGLYHSGDCVPYPGLAERLRALGIDVALLPINGRDAHRLSRGVPGNFGLGEALALARAAGAGILVGHHYGMFGFNTVEPEGARKALEAGYPGGRCLLARAGVVLRLGPRTALPAEPGGRAPPAVVDGSG